MDERGEAVARGQIQRVLHHAGQRFAVAPLYDDQRAEEGMNSYTREFDQSNG